MSEFEELSTKLNGWLEKQGYDDQDRYFIFKGLAEDIWDSIKNGPEDDEDELEDYADLDEFETDESIEDVKPIVKKPKVKVKNGPDKKDTGKP